MLPRRYEPVNEYESGNSDRQSYFMVTNTGPLQDPTSETIPAIGKSVRLRACDFATLENGVITSHTGSTTTRWIFRSARADGRDGVGEAVKGLPGPALFGPGRQDSDVRNQP
jgi:hypothetical protein